MSVHRHVAHRSAHSLQCVKQRSTREWTRYRADLREAENGGPTREPVVRYWGEVAALEHNIDDIGAIGINQVFSDGEEDGGEVRVARRAGVVSGQQRGQGPEEWRWGLTRACEWYDERAPVRVSANASTLRSEKRRNYILERTDVTC